MRPSATPVTRTLSSTSTSPVAPVRRTRRPRSSCCCTAGSGSRSGTAGTPGTRPGHSPTWAPWWRRRSTAVSRGGGGWPVTGDDVLLAVRRLPELLGGLGIATGATRIIGHSAGGHLALWLATRDVPASSASWPWRRSATCARRSGCGLGDHATQALLGDLDPAGGRPDDPARRAARRRGRDRARRGRRHRPRLPEPRLRRPGTPGWTCTRCPAATWSPSSPARSPGRPSSTPWP